MEFPKPPEQHRGSFWFYGRRHDTWDIGVKLLVWGAVLAAAVYFAWAIS